METKTMIDGLVPMNDPNATTLVPPSPADEPVISFEMTAKSRLGEVAIDVYKIMLDLTKEEQERVLRATAIILKLDHIIR